jgi:hypothetical protein
MQVGCFAQSSDTKWFESDPPVAENCHLYPKRIWAMKFEGTFQYMGNHGIVFNVSQVTLTDSERGRLRELHFGEAKHAHYEVNSKVVEVYDKMQAKGLPCVMMIGISKPLTRQQGDALNAQRTTIANLAAAAFASASKAVAPLTWRHL